jgi:hypothetical protein
MDLHARCPTEPTRHLRRLLPSQNLSLVPPALPRLDRVHHRPCILYPFVTCKFATVQEQAAAYHGRHLVRIVCFE